MFDKTFDTIVDIISEFTDFVLYTNYREQKRRIKKSWRIYMPDIYTISYNNS